MSLDRVLVVIPAMNEEASLPAALAAVRREAPGAHVVVVDDGSTDATAGIAREHGVAVLRHVVNLGVGAALQTGFRYAMAHGHGGKKGQRQVVHDADGTAIVHRRSGAATPHAQGNTVGYPAVSHAFIPPCTLNTHVCP